MEENVTFVAGWMLVGMVAHNILGRLIVGKWPMIIAFNNLPHHLTVREAVGYGTTFMVATAAMNLGIWSWLLQFVPVWVFFLQAVVSEVVILAYLAKKKKN